MRVRPHAPNLLVQLLRPLDRIFRVYLARNLSVLLEKSRVFEQTDDLAPERDRLLIQPPLLRVTNIGSDDFIKRQLVPSFLVTCNLLGVRICLQGELAPDGILDIEDGGVDAGSVERFGRGGRRGVAVGGCHGGVVQPD